MNPARPPVSPNPGRPYSSESMQLPNPLYSVHVNAAVAGPSTQRLQPLSTTPDTTSFYPAHLVQRLGTPQPPPLPSKPPALATPLPPSLMPGGPGRSRPRVLSTLESSLLFQSKAPPPAASSSSPAYARPRLYSENLSSSRPPLPPKPHVQTRTSFASLTDSTAPKIPPKPFYLDEKQASPSASSPDAEEEELVARAMEISLRDTGAAGPPDLEDEVLARVLEESIASNGISSSAAHDDAHGHQETDSRQFEMSSRSPSSSCASSSAASVLDTPPTSVHPHTAHGDSAEKHNPYVSVKTDLKDFAKQEQELIRAEDVARRRQMEMDEEFARSIAQLEADGSSSSSNHSPLSSASVTPGALSASTSTDTIPRPPLNNATRPSSFHVASLQQQIAPHSHTSLPPPVTSGSRPLPSPNLGRGYGSYTAGGPVPPISAYDKLGRSISAQATIPTVNSFDGPPMRPMSYHANPVIPVQHRRNSGNPEVSPTNSTSSGRSVFTPNNVPVRSMSTGKTIGPAPSEVEENVVLENCESPPMSPISINERDEGQLVSKSGPSSPPIVEDELLLGISIGFNAPSMARRRDPMQGPIPNIITLPLGKCPPLHIQAPNWKHLLKLLTRLSDSRVEPTVEALATTKSELKLRTVIQFMKVHHSSDDWRTIIYLTLDVPVPPSTPNMHKYTSGDVNALPYSYTMSPLPALLRAGAGDSNLSKCFTVPATANTPYPTLPMTLPELALYLLSVLDESRRASNDSSGGLRKLSRTIDNLYPADSPEGVAPEFDFPNKGSMGKFFKRVVGRGNRDSSHVQRGGNVERFEFITPFRIDEYH